MLAQRTTGMLYGRVSVLVIHLMTDQILPDLRDNTVVTWKNQPIDNKIQLFNMTTTIDMLRHKPIIQALKILFQVCMSFRLIALDYFILSYLI